MDRLSLITLLCSSDMARSKAIVTKEETSSEPLGGAHGRGSRRPPIISYQKEKQKIDTKVNAPATRRRPRKGVQQYKGSHLVEHQETYLIINCGKTKGQSSEVLL
ncbi:hypothetical protein Syun_009327 [Stephania yunnanensis]|uniref:Uncharacterized protein n=1 Tax=Stephania yunnanensis TaxID=152371 RepID=A0AAP0KEB3_9MAGN